MACEASGGEGIRSQTMDQTDARESSINNQHFVYVHTYYSGIRPYFL